MPRASWRGFLRLSLVSCPIYLSPATTRRGLIAELPKFGRYGRYFRG
jgi:non-homologous end joining protein Ku